MKKLENPQQAIYDVIVSYYEQHSYPPTVREICAAVGLNSPSTVHAHLAKLEQKGMIQRNHTKQRSLVITATQPPATKNVPLVGQVAAGQPIFAVENIEGSLALPNELLHGGDKDEVFLLRVEGDSMIEAGILSGDFILVHKGLDYTNGDIVVAQVQGETTTVKRIYRETNHVRLQPENAAMAPILVPYPQVEVVGKVISLIRQY